MEYPGMLISSHKEPKCSKFNFDKDKTAMDYIKSFQIKKIEIEDDFRIQIIEKDGSMKVSNKPESKAVA